MNGSFKDNNIPQPVVKEQKRRSLPFRDPEKEIVPAGKEGHQCNIDQSKMADPIAHSIEKLILLGLELCLFGEGNEPVSCNTEKEI